MKIAAILGFILIVSTAGTYLFDPSDKLKQAETQLEQTAGAKLKDTWPAFRDSLCRDMTAEELNDCRIYQTQLFEEQIRLYRATKKTGLVQENPIK
jgi:hypothetical protein